MDLTPQQLDGLLGAWALDALEPDEQEAVDAALAVHPEVAGEAPGLRALVALMGEAVASPAPPELRTAVLRSAAASAPVALVATDPVTLMANQIRAFDQLMGTLGPDDWSRRAEPYDWTVHGLLAHLLVIEQYTAHQLGLASVEWPPEPRGHLAMGAGIIAAEQQRSPTETLQAWHETARSTLDAFQAGQGPVLDSMVELHGWPVRVEGLLVARSFETWTHGDDIRRATGRPLSAPSPADLRAMSQFSVSTLPLILSFDRDKASLGPTRVVLTGDGGGTYDLGAPGDQPSEGQEPLLMVLDVVDYCHWAARRVNVEDLGLVVQGDRVTADRLLRAAQLLAV